MKSPQRLPNYYRLLDLKLYEGNRERIQNAERGPQAPDGAISPAAVDAANWRWSQELEAS